MSLLSLKNSRINNPRLHDRVLLLINRLLLHSRLINDYRIIAYIIKNQEESNISVTWQNKSNLYIKLYGFY